MELADPHGQGRRRGRVNLEFLPEQRNVVLVRRGKTMVAQNIAHQAVQKGHTALFITASQMFLDLCGQESARALERRLKHYARPTVLCIDEVGTSPTTGATRTCSSTPLSIASSTTPTSSRSMASPTGAAKRRPARRSRSRGSRRRQLARPAVASRTHRRPAHRRSRILRISVTANTL